MQIPLQISFRNMDPSPAVEAIVREKAAKLDRFLDRIVSCDVTIEAPHRHHHKGKLYKVRSDIGIRGKDVHVSGRPEEPGARGYQCRDPRRLRRRGAPARRSCAAAERRRQIPWCLAASSVLFPRVKRSPP